MARFDIYQDRREQWRWRLIANNGEKVASSGESFSTRSNAVRAAQTVKRLAPGATLPPDILAQRLRRRMAGGS
jgi:uncharacterized protein YegP (UPF0339 family)